MADEKCSVNGCNEDAVNEVFLYDFYPNDTGKAFIEQDFTCPFICKAHTIENEATGRGKREPRGFVEYKYTNQNGAQGYTIYKSLDREGHTH